MNDVDVTSLSDADLHAWHDALLCEHIMLDDGVRANWRRLQQMDDVARQRLNIAVDKAIESRARAAQRVEAAHAIEQGEAREDAASASADEPLLRLQYHAARLVHLIQIGAPDVIIDAVYDMTLRYAAQRQKNKEQYGR